MPLVLSRRRFLQTGAGVIVSACGSAENRSTRWALLADTHISADPQDQYRGFRPYENLKKIVPDVARFRPDGVLIDGDLARLRGLEGDYANLQALIEPLTAKHLTAMSLGNHDDRANFMAAVCASEAVPLQPVRNKYVAVIENPPVRLVILDSLIRANETPGLLGQAQRTWLDNFLARAGTTPILLFVHHTLDDDDASLLDADRFLRITAKHASVKAVFYGHSHRYKYDVLEGMHLVNLPAVGYNFRDSEPVGWVEATFTAQGAELRLNAFGGNTLPNGKTTSLSWRS
ncbi:MAG TPA: metallophosphoesterase [Bryobacteraceae bacterium]|nr:metallophosphoesterase [Bryobacteraceae bacterium]